MVEISYLMFIGPYLQNVVDSAFLHVFLCPCSTFFVNVAVMEMTVELLNVELLIRCSDSYKTKNHVNQFNSVFSDTGKKNLPLQTLH